MSNSGKKLRKERLANTRSKRHETNDHWIKRWSKRIWWLVGLAVTIGSLIALAPSLEISLGDPIDPNDQLSRPLVVHNESYYPVSDVSVEFYVANMQEGTNTYQNNRFRVTKQFYYRLKRNERVTLPLGLKLAQTITSADAVATATYTLPFLPFYHWVQETHFVGAHTASGIVWQEQPVEPRIERSAH